MATETDHLFDFEEEILGFADKNDLPVSLLKEIKVELCERLMHSAEADDQTDGPLNFLQNIVENVKAEFDNFVEEGEENLFLQVLSKIFAILLSVKADSSEKIIIIIRLAISTVIKVRTKLVPKRVRIRRWPPREPYVKFKIKTILPEQKTIQIRKNSRPVRTVTVRRKTIKFTDRWARQF